MKKIIFLFHFILFAVVLPKVLFEIYTIECPNKEFLSWDGNLRYIKTLDILEDFQKARYFDFLINIIDTPTWPSFRNLVEFIFFKTTGTHSPETTIYITHFTAIVLVFSILYILYKEVENSFLFALFTFISFYILYTVKPLLIYSFSAMLEIQGALFLLWSLYNLYRLYSDESYIEFTTNKLKLFLSIFLLFQTKYPYGYMLILSIFIFQFLFFTESSLFFFVRYLSYAIDSFQKNKILISASLLIFLFLFIPESILKGKTKTYIKYIIIIFLMFDFYKYLFNQNKELYNLNFNRWMVLSKWIFLPIILFILIHPDRFGSSSGTIAHVQSEGQMVGVLVEKNLDYYLIFFKTIYKELMFGLLFCLLLVLSIFYKIKEKNNISIFIVFSSLLLIQILILSLLTANHQERHIYHLFPSLSLLIPFLYTQIKGRVKLIYLISLSTLFLINWSPIQKPNLCFSGKEKEIYFTPRFIYSHFKENNLLNENKIIYNGINPIHLNKSDTEMMIRKLAFEENKEIIFDLKKVKQIQKLNFNSILFIIDSCDKNKLNLMGKVLSTYNPKLSLQVEYNSEFKKDIFVLKEGIGKIDLNEKYSLSFKDPNFNTNEGCLQFVELEVMK
jgi:hypothetical protein